MAIEKVDRTVEKLLESLGLGAVGIQARLAGSWKEVVGPLLAAKTRPARLRGGVLTVGAVSPAWAQELSLSRDAVLERIDAVLGKGKVREIRVGVGAVPENEDGAAPREEGGTPERDAGDAPERPAPEGLERVSDPEMRGILASLARKAAGRIDKERKVPGRP